MAMEERKIKSMINNRNDSETSEDDGVGFQAANDNESNQQTWRVSHSKCYSTIELHLED